MIPDKKKKCTVQLSHNPHSIKISHEKNNTVVKVTPLSKNIVL